MESEEKKSAKAGKKPKAVKGQPKEEQAQPEEEQAQPEEEQAQPEQAAEPKDDPAARIADRVVSTARQVGSAVVKGFETGRATAQEKSRWIKEKVQERDYKAIVNAPVDWVKGNPKKSIAIAAGAGLLAGLVTWRIKAKKSPPTEEEK